MFQRSIKASLSPSAANIAINEPKRRMATMLASLKKYSETIMHFKLVELLRIMRAIHIVCSIVSHAHHFLRLILDHHYPTERNRVRAQIYMPMLEAATRTFPLPRPTRDPSSPPEHVSHSQPPSLSSLTLFSNNASIVFKAPV